MTPIRRVTLLAVVCAAIPLAGIAGNKEPAAASLSGQYTVFDPPNCSAFFSQINSRGDMAGSCYTSGFVRDAAGRITVVAFPGATFTSATSINDNGVFTGSYGDTNTLHGYIDAGGARTTFDCPGALRTYPLQVNNEGEVSGYYETPEPHGFVRLPSGQIVTYDVPDADYLQPLGLNEKGVVAGYTYNTITFVHQSFVWTPASGVVIVTPPGLTGATVLAINDSGALLGNDLNTSFLLFRGGVLKQYAGPGTFTAAAVNNKDIMVGFALTNPFTAIGILQLPSGRYATLTAPSAVRTWPQSINENNQVVGWFEDSRGAHGFLFTPAPGAIQ